MINLENFPESESAKRMMLTITQGFYDRSYVAKWLFEVIGQEMDTAKALYDELQQQIFPQTATWGLIYHELKYGITALPEDSYETRRNRILSRMQLRGAMNPERMRSIIEGITGKPCEIVENISDYTFTVHLTIATSDGNINEQELRKEIYKIKPSHLGFNVVTDRPHEASIYIGAAMQNAEIIYLRQVV